MYNKILFILVATLLCGTVSAIDIPAISSVSSNVSNELDSLNALINATKQNLDNQIAIKKQIESYQKLQQLYLKNADDKELLFQMVKSAYRLQDAIKSNHLDHAFSTEFLNELNVFAQVANKRAIPKP
jgi:hypothetical protein